MIYLRLFLEFFKVGLFAVGGGMATFPFLEDLAVKTGWYTQLQLADMIAVSESTPGPIGVNMATYVGFSVAGIPGSVIATLGLITPSVIIILIVARVLAKFRDSRLVKDLFYGLRPASAGLIAAAGFAVVVLSLVDKSASGLGMIHWKGVALGVVMLLLTRKVKQTKSLHPVVFIALSAVVGAVFSFAGV
ncbi:MAG: chromate transporter [Oscillospiraceae bacterium]|nr:chromate transporter [Oscillospiraceae bacterium]